MFTSRAEFRLHLRIDNADERLTPIARRVGMITAAEWDRFSASQVNKAKVRSFVESYRPRAAEVAGIEGLGSWAHGSTGGQSLAQLLRRPEVEIEALQALVQQHTSVELKRSDWKSIETDIKYQGYLAQQRRQVEHLAKMGGRRIPVELQYAKIPGLSTEVIEKMQRIRPATLGQAARIPGVTAAAVQILNVFLAAGR